MSGKLRVLPLGGVGEIGKNMTVVEYEGRMVIVDCGLRFPTAEMMGIDLVLPDFSYVRDNIDAQLQEVYAAMFITASPAPVKAALKMQGHDTGPLRLPLVECDETERTAIHDVLARHGLLAGVTAG